MRRRICYLTLLLILPSLTGCSDVLITEKDKLLFHTINQIIEQVDQEQWDTVQSNLEVLENKYQQRKLKMQILGELDDYKSIELEIEKLKVSVKEEDELEAKVSLRQIRHLMLRIYNL